MNAKTILFPVKKRTNRCEGDQGQYTQFRRRGKIKEKRNNKKGENTILKSNSTYKYHYRECHIKDTIKEKPVKTSVIIAKNSKIPLFPFSH
jgi:hypothetical protein